jgi:acyl dehydratase
MPLVLDDAEALLSAAGRSLGETDWLEMTQQRIDRFAEATDDYQWIHVDVERARRGTFGAPIAHGYLTLSLISHFLPQLLHVPKTVMAIHDGCNKVRFPAPVPVGARIRGSGELLSAERVAGGVQVVARISVEVDGVVKPACSAELVSRYLFG